MGAKRADRGRDDDRKRGADAERHPHLQRYAGQPEAFVEHRHEDGAAAACRTRRPEIPTARRPPSAAGRVRCASLGFEAGRRVFEHPALADLATRASAWATRETWRLQSGPQNPHIRSALNGWRRYARQHCTGIRRHPVRADVASRGRSGPPTIRSGCRRRAGASAIASHVSDDQRLGRPSRRALAASIRLAHSLASADKQNQYSVL